MPCGCKDRRNAIVQGVKAAASGDTEELARQAEVFSKSVQTDARRLNNAFRDRITAARQNLARR